MRRRTIVVGCVSLLLAAGHLYYWYWPRARPAALQPDSSTGRLFRGEHELAFWVPYPHQNLAPLAELARSRSVADLADTLEFERGRLPAFGPLSLPPAHDLAVAADSGSGRLSLTARVYPSVRWLGRAAGWLAGNPWLSGGRFEVEGRSVEVAWVSGDWTVRIGPPGSGVVAQLEAPATEALALVSSRRQRGVLPAGVFEIVREGPHVDVRLGRWRDLALQSPPGLSGAATWAARSTPSGRPGFDVLAVFEGKSELPGMAVAHRGGGRRWELPAEGLFELVGGDLPRRRAAGWHVVGSDAEALERASALVASFTDLADARAGRAQPLVVWIDVARTRSAFRPVVSRLAELPLDLGSPWVRWFDGVGELSTWSHVSLAVQEAPEPAVHARLWHASDPPVLR